jgi:hypothetical protein
MISAGMGYIPCCSDMIGGRDQYWDFISQTTDCHRLRFGASLKCESPRDRGGARAKRFQFVKDRCSLVPDEVPAGRDTALGKPMFF